MLSIEPVGSGSQMDGTKEVARGLVIARGSSAVLFEPDEEVFDQVMGLAQLAVQSVRWRLRELIGEVTTVLPICNRSSISRA